MKTFKKIYNIYTYLSIFLHELSHILMVYVLGSKIESVSFECESDDSVSVLLELDEKNLSKFKSFLFAYSPYMMIILIGFLSIFSTFFLILFVYTLTNFIEGIALPSKVDKEFFRTCGEEFVEIEYDEDTELSIV